MELLEWFINTFPSLVKKMKECSYHYDHETLNKHHLEGDVWTHTMMALAHAVNNEVSVTIQWAVLLHDIGRIYTRYENKADQYVEFGDFEGVSCYMALEIMNKARLKKKEQIKILKIISYHYTIIDHVKYDTPSLGEMLKTFKYEEESLLDLADYVECDLRGRIITESRKHLYAFNQIQQKITAIKSTPLNRSKHTTRNQTLYLLVGPPGAGKSTWVGSHKDINRSLLISRDSCILEVGKKYGKNNYDDAYDFTYDNKVIKKEVDALDEARELVAKETKTKNIIIDNPNLKIGNRKEWIDELKQTHMVKVILFLTPFHILSQRNDKRSTVTKKSITHNELIIKLKTFSFPLPSEGIDEIEHVF